MGKKGGNLRLSHIQGLTFMMNKDILEHPAKITFFSLVAIMSGADDVAHLAEEFLLCHCRLR